MKEKEYICVLCPKSCAVTVRIENGQVGDVSGYSCEKGKIWAVEEVESPRRFFAGSVTVTGGDFETVSVKTTGAIPLESLVKVGIRTHSIVLQAPVIMHQVVEHNILGLGVDLIATREVHPREVHPGAAS